jgi:hypothetical protein
MPGFKPHCPKCNSLEVEQLGMHDHYAKDADGKDTALDATIFAYKCECGLAFSFEIKHGQKPISKATGLR